MSTPTREPQIGEIWRGPHGRHYLVLDHGVKGGPTHIVRNRYADGLDSFPGVEVKWLHIYAHGLCGLGCGNLKGATCDHTKSLDSGTRRLFVYPEYLETGSPVPDTLSQRSYLVVPLAMGSSLFPHISTSSQWAMWVTGTTFKKLFHPDPTDTSTKANYDAFLLAISGGSIYAADMFQQGLEEQLRAGSVSGTMWSAATSALRSAAQKLFTDVYGETPNDHRTYYFPDTVPEAIEEGFKARNAVSSAWLNRHTSYVRNDPGLQKLGDVTIGYALSKCSDPRLADQYRKAESAVSRAMSSHATEVQETLAAVVAFRNTYVPEGPLAEVRWTDVDGNDIAPEVLNPPAPAAEATL